MQQQKPPESAHDVFVCCETTGLRRTPWDGIPLRDSALLLFGLGVLASPAIAQTPVDGRIVRVVYHIVYDGGGPSSATWGFHLAHMKDGRYCVRLGNPGRLTLAIIAKVGDVCFDGIPGSVDRSPEQRSRSYDAREKGKQITVVSTQKGSIASSGNDITLDITTCNRVEGEPDDALLPQPLCRAHGRAELPRRGDALGLAEPRRQDHVRALRGAVRRQFGTRRLSLEIEPAAAAAGSVLLPASLGSVRFAPGSGPA